MMEQLNLFQLKCYTKLFWNKFKYGILLSLDITILLFGLEIAFPYQSEYVHIFHITKYDNLIGLLFVIYASYSLSYDIFRYLSRKKPIIKYEN